MNALMTTLAAFADSVPADSPCADPGALRGYLSDRRITLFNDLLQRCQHHGIQFGNTSVADIGCGTGYLLRLINQHAPDARLSGYDTFVEMLGLAERLCPDADFVPRNLLQVSEHFDRVFCTETLEHLVEPERALQALYERVSPGGWLIITVPDGRKDQSESGDKREDGTAYWGHIHFWSPESWPLFLNREIGQTAKILCDRCTTGENIGLVHKPMLP